MPIAPMRITGEAQELRLVAYTVQMPASEAPRLATKDSHLEEQITAKVRMITGHLEDNCYSAVFVAKRIFTRTGGWRASQDFPIARVGWFAGIIQAEHSCYLRP